jgi:tripeptide aminopeptidase
LEDGVIRSDGSTILGADDKAGIAEMLEALRIAEIHPPVEVAISRQEEVGLYGVKNMDFSLINAKRGFLLDNDTLETNVIGGPSYFAIDVEIKGRSAHAGMEPEKGINAILAAAKAIANLRLGRLDHETTANVGVIKGGTIRNGVPDSASFLAECRSLNHAKAQALADEMVKIITEQVESVQAKADIKADNLCKAVDIPEDSLTVQLSKKALQKVGIDAKTTFITGFTDASIYNNMGIEMAVVGIGARLEHSTEEHIYVSDMEKALDFALQFTPTRIIITAAFGKRKDHSFINLLIFQKYSGKVSLEIIDDFGKMRILQSGKHTLHGFPKKTISLFSLGEIRSLTLSGFKYNLQSRDFKSYFYGLSNVYLSEKVCIEFSSGTLFVYEVWSGKEGKKYLP